MQSFVEGLLGLLATVCSLAVVIGLMYLLVQLVLGDESKRVDARYFKALQDRENEEKESEREQAKLDSDRLTDRLWAINPELAAEIKRGQLRPDQQDQRGEEMRR
ncbi:hypothetical protein ACWFMI_23345 [Nocardiopsis terrae]|uniref:hypothetical protein n=1 Tax=Streptomyces sp. NPDC057554 TaxID=3350538 RepID=UPI0036B6DD24